MPESKPINATPTKATKVEPVDLNAIAVNTVEWILLLYELKPQDGASPSLTSAILSSLQLVAASKDAEIERLKNLENVKFASSELNKLASAEGKSRRLLELRTDDLTAANQKIEQLKAALAAKGEK